MTKFLVTGANGFVGRAFCKTLVQRGFPFTAVSRGNSDTDSYIAIGDINGLTNWSSLLAGIDIVVHLAAHVHVSKTNQSAEIFHQVNVNGTANLARQAAQAGVKRLVFVSSIKVNGEYTEAHPFTENYTPCPVDSYGKSKLEAEHALWNISRETGMEIVVVRPPLVYGPGVKANFLKLLTFIEHGIPLPLGDIQNMRSLIYIENLVDALCLCATHPLAAGRVYLVSDDEDISTPQLIRQLAILMKKPPRLMNLPAGVLKFLASLIGKASELDRLQKSLQIDSSAIRQQLGWEPKISLQKGLQETVSWYEKQNDTSNISFSANSSMHGCDRSVVIVNYNAGDYLLECVSKARQQAEQVIVVDNASKDDSMESLKKAYPDVKIISNERNLGFAVACNMGARAADGKYILFLNPDCFLEPDAIAILIESINSAPDIGMVGGLIINPDGTEQIGGRRAIPTPWRSFVRGFGLSKLSNWYPRLFSDFSLHSEPLPKQPIEVEAISGACMLTRQDILEEVGLLDEGYFMHCEDLDWCMRFHLKNWKILFVPNARMVHYKGHCSQSRPVFVEWNKHKGMMRFYLKFFKTRYSLFLMPLIWAGVWVRFGLIVLLHTIKNAGHKVRSSFE